MSIIFKIGEKKIISKNWTNFTRKYFTGPHMHYTKYYKDVCISWMINNGYFHNVYLVSKVRTKIWIICAITSTIYSYICRILLFQSGWEMSNWFLDVAQSSWIFGYTWKSKRTHVLSIVHNWIKESPVSTYIYMNMWV